MVQCGHDACSFCSTSVVCCESHDSSGLWIKVRVVDISVLSGACVFYMGCLYTEVHVWNDELDGRSCVINGIQHYTLREKCCICYVYPLLLSEEENEALPSILLSARESIPLFPLSHRQQGSHDPYVTVMSSYCTTEPIS